MSTSDSDNEIQRFLEGDLSPEELKEFEQKLSQDPDLAREVRDYERLVMGLEAAGLDDFRSEVKGWEAGYHAKHGPDREGGKDDNKVIPITRYIPIAAAVALLLFAGIYFYLNRSAAPQTLYATYYAPYPDMLTDRGDTTINKSGRSMLLAGIEAYNTENFQLAIDNLQAYLKAEPDQKGVALYLAISQMELNRFEAAEESFKTAREDPVFRQQAEWYEGLSNLKAGNLPKSKAIFKDIAENPSHYRQEDARRLWNSLD